MPQTCSVCKHSRLDEINAALVAGGTLWNIAEKFLLTMSSLYRHKQHMPAGLIKAKEAKEVAKADTLLEQVCSLRDMAIDILRQAEKDGDLRTALLGVKEARACLELLAKLQGELSQADIVNVLIAPQWLSLRTVILRELESYPEAKVRLAEALKKYAEH
ncbi:MAG: hypothetical protein DDT37_01721 [Firmicutes bacterium]|nr:hypothetical protein [candidate division NPL-UPA2 bacterium]